MVIIVLFASNIVLLGCVSATVGFLSALWVFTVNVPLIKEIMLLICPNKMCKLHRWKKDIFELCIVTLNVTPLRLLLAHFATANQLPGFSKERTLSGNGLKKPVL